MDLFQEELKNAENLRFVNTRIFNPFSRTVDEVILGETRGLDADSRGVITLTLEILISSTQVTSAALYGFTVDLLINLMDEDLVSSISQLFPHYF